MPTKQIKISGQRISLDARPDRPDLRDRLYQPPLRSLPPEYPSAQRIKKYLPAYCKAQLVLDQGQEGACTGFGLAAVINYLLFVRHIESRTKHVPVSARMIYELARRYDEWPGEDYDGSSCRGAMKGWFHHGACSDKLWPYRKNGQVVFVEPDEDWDKDAAERPIGAYYRIDAESIADMQAAINEVGAIYVSADVHPGWDLDEKRTLPLPTIKWTPGTKPNGGHAFALVGYDVDGFIVQNSWGSSWGYLGFGRLLYDDWLANHADAWVAVLGAPIAARAPAIILSSNRTVPSSSREFAKGLVNGATADAIEARPSTRPDAWDLATAVKHCLVLGNEGRPSLITVKHKDGASAANEVTLNHPLEWLDKQPAGTRRIAIYAHGGLNKLSEGLARAQVLGPWFLKNGIYPIFVVWQSGYFESLANIIADVLRNSAASVPPRRGAVIEALSDVSDRMLEVLAIPAARPVWSEMKENAIAASRPKGGMSLLAQNLKELSKEVSNKLNRLEVHLVGHSAGAIVLGAFLPRLTQQDLIARTTSLYAPACTVGFAIDHYLAAANNKTIDPKSVVVELLSDKNERADTVGGAYGKSLLYLVSRALEPCHKTPLLGMEAAWNPAFDRDDIFLKEDRRPINEDVKAWRTEWKGGSPTTLDNRDVVDSLHPNGDPRSTTRSAHGCFDNSIECMERTLARILSLDSVAKLRARITSLQGF